MEIIVIEFQKYYKKEEFQKIKFKCSFNKFHNSYYIHERVKKYLFIYNIYNNWKFIYCWCNSFSTQH